MSEKSNISWTDATWSPVTGCDPISAGCKNCYAKREVEQRWRKNPKSVFFGRAFNDVQCHESALSQPLSWKKPRKIFVCPRADLFHDDVPFEFIDRVFAVMALASQHTFQVLTKRPERMRKYLTASDLAQRVINEAFRMDCEGGAWMNADHNIGGYKIMPLPNVWLGVSVEDQAAADERIPLLLDTPAVVRWISAEPLLGRVDLCETFGMWWNQTMDCFEASHSSGFNRNPRNLAETAIDWVVVGGESGPKARPMHPEWARSLRDQCAAASVPFLFKQWGEWWPVGKNPHGAQDSMRRLGHTVTCHAWPDGETVVLSGKKSAGRLLDGVQHDGYPEGGAG